MEKYDNIDELTGLYNLNGILSHLQGHETRAAEGSIVIIYLNVMNFKSFNQRYGFVGGNEFLRGLAGEIKGLFPEELIARTAGDQFIILANSLDEKEITDRLTMLSEASARHDKGLRLHIKAGIYQQTGDETDPVIMIDRAKTACDDIIRVYDKSINFYDEALSKKNELRQYVIDNFESAFKNRYFKVYYQKEVRALTGKVCGYEALARWQDPVMGIISPLIFIEVLEDVHLIHKLDLCIIDMVCKDLRDDIDSGYAVEPVSVNLSQLDFELCDIMAEIDKCRAKYDIPVELLHIEVTESALTTGENFLDQQIKKFRQAGYEIWMDDFGSGYSSLNNLKTFDIDVLKIDMDFLRTFDTNKKTQVILAMIVNMAKELGIHTLAEGVETKEQYEFLRRIGCEKLQGYLFGKPTPVDDFDRAVDCSLDVCEDFSLTPYYDRIGEVNFLGNTPLRDKSFEVFNNLPLAIIELQDDIAQCIYANRAYLDYLSSLGFASLSEANSVYGTTNHPDIVEYTACLKRAQASPDHRAYADIVTNGNTVNHKVRFLFDSGDRQAFAVVSRNTSIHEESDTAESLRVAMAHVFNQYFRVDFFDEDGTVDNIFLNADQKSVSDYTRDTKEAVRLYSEMYIYPEDKERFKKFYDITTVRERIENTKSAYVVDYYRSATPGDNGRMQMYMILPFYYNGKWKFISLCRYADEIRDDALK
ncbi:bifunctional diguanylate cyclase/phosphodiesterase [Butyrivibrio sp. FCS006]|uniref:bifunctional diguanylate cyclase/phosphodiesterase n=1 Tax=Butyrivibrio sp. FCS006 TaxID=1280684 RepID=UPI000424E07F|nr:bifunctional diguanylate cyclase/phosphodiesterase [Butyrivibrio sp. FCS006]